MRIVIVGAEPTGLGRALASYLHLDLVRTVAQLAARIPGDGFVLDGEPRDVAAARTLDARLRAHAAEVDAVVWVAAGTPSPEVESVLDHYRGRVLEVAPGDDPLEATLDGLRELLLAA